MRKRFTRKLSLAVLGLLPFAALHAQTLDPQLALEKAQATRPQWAGPDYSAAEVRLSSAYAEASGLEHVYVQQLYRGIPVYNQVQSLAFKGNRLALHTGSFVPAKQLAALAATPGITAAAAVSRALQHVRGTATGTPPRLTVEDGPEARQTFDKLDVAHHDIVASLTWGFDKNQRPHLTWNVNVDLVDTPDWWNVRVDAQTGAIVAQDNWTTHEAAPERAAAAPATPTKGYQALNALLALAPPPPTTGSSSYLVVPFPQERPGTTGTGFVADTAPWLRAGATNNAVTHGWHFDGTTNYTTTRGNNVAAYDDGASTNSPGNYATSLTGSPTLSFNYPADFTQNAASTANRNAAITNLFYWNNIIHDLTYQYGFTEAAGNFQADNLGRGGSGGDYVRAEAQDGAGVSNANFSTPNDGSSGRMQMYLWNPTAPAYSLTVTAPTAVAGSYTAVEGRISANNRLSAVGPVSGELALYTDAGATTSLACTAFGGTTPLTGKIALLYRGGTTACTYPIKVKNAQLAGAIGVIVVNNAAGNPVTMFGTDNSITIPAVMISQANGALLAAQIANAVQVTLPVNANTIQRDGDFDNGVMVHEYGHGISNRLTGGPANSSCLSNAEQGGEGWSDYLALMMTTNWTTAQLTDGPNARPVGTFAAGQAVTAGGIRRYPYSTSLTTDPLTYANVATSPEVHNIGEVWCSALWDMTWNVIQQNGRIEPNLYNTATDPGGNIVALQLVMQGMKLQPCQPGFLDARDAILAADSLLYNGAYHCAIWRAFARRGMGFSAQEGLSTSAIDQVPASDLPPAVILDKQESLRIGTSFNMSFKLSCGCPPAPAAPYTLTAELPTGLQFVSSSTGGTLVGNKVTFSNLNFTTPGQTATVGYVAQATAAATCPIVTPINDNRDNALVGGFASQIVLGTTGWAPSSTRAYSPTSAWYAAEPAVDSDFVLTSAPFTPTGLSLLSFFHYFNFEGSYDGGTVELSTDNGTTWLDATSYFVQNGYNSTFDASTMAPGLRCFSGQSGKSGGSFIRSLLDLRSFAGQPMLMRFRVRTDTGNSTAVEGWTGAVARSSWSCAPALVRCKRRSPSSPTCCPRARWLRKPAPWPPPASSWPTPTPSAPLACKCSSRCPLRSRAWPLPCST
jgi:extracellular elastinolytic metalloproteinase